nr:MAG TPA: hypothetical protein [Caudoviricetes sp.]
MINWYEVSFNGVAYISAASAKQAQDYFNYIIEQAKDDIFQDCFEDTNINISSTKTVSEDLI